MAANFSYWTRPCNEKFSSVYSAFQVSVTAMEESRVLLWHRDKLKLTIIADSFLQAVFDHILGRDVVKKLMQVGYLMKLIDR